VGLRYRLRQLSDNLKAGPLPPPARREIAAVLSEAENKLFERFSHADQQHSYRVLRLLWDAGYNNPDLLVAAVLHDIGKTCYPLSVWDRILIVVGEKFVPDRAANWGSGSPDSWKRPFVVRSRHPIWGADMAAAAGSSLGAVDLIRRHQDKVDPDREEEDVWLARLQWADDQS
jgi:hypothetical protein